MSHFTPIAITIQPREMTVLDVTKLQSERPFSTISLGYGVVLFTPVTLVQPPSSVQSNSYAKHTPIATPAHTKLTKPKNK